MSQHFLSEHSLSEQSIGALPPDRSNDDGVLIELRDQPRRRATDRVAVDASSLTRFEQEQLAREYADIERASAALRLGQPQLRSLSTPAVPAAAKKPRALWLLIGILWLSTAVITVGAVAAIATLAG